MSYFFTLRFKDLPELEKVGHDLGFIDSDADKMPDLYVCDHDGLQGQAQLITDVVAPGTYDDDGNELTPPVPVPGVFINLILNRRALSSRLRAYRVPYGSAGQVWAGTEPEPGAWPPT